MNWADVLPERIAMQQTAWERSMQILRARDAGLTQKEIGRRFGLSTGRIHQLEHYGRRQLAKSDRAPVTRWLNDGVAWGEFFDDTRRSCS